MDSTKTAFVDASVSPAAGAAAVTPTSETTLTITESQLREIVAAVAAQAIASQGAAPASARLSTAAAPRQATRPETCAAHKLLTLLDRATTKVIVGTRDRVLVPANVYLVDKATPQSLAIIAAGSIIAASSARKVSDYFARLAETAAATSATLTRR